MASSGESSSDAPSSSSSSDDDDDARVSAPPVASSSSSSSRVVAASRASSSSSTKPSRQHQPRASRPSSRAKRKSKPAPIAVCLTNCKYELLRCVQKKLGWIEVGSDAEDWQLYWTDTSVSIERVMRLKATQKINHFTGMLEICRKKQLAKNLARMSALFPSEFKFAPKTWTLPLELESFLDQFPRKASKPGKRTFILKPDAGCQGKGIALAQSQDHVLKALENINVDVEGESKGSNAVVAQRYLSKPFLIDGYKFDLRVYALVICADPLRVFVFNDGLARFCTEKYEPPGKGNLKDTCMHLTNYAVNKHNENFVFNDDAGANGAGSKWSVQGLKDWMEDNGHDFVGAWEGIVDLIVKTIVSVQPVLAHNYHSVLPPETNDGYSCFEILGVDVMLDENLRPWLIEVNHSPSFGVDTPLDLAIKGDLISDAIELVRIDPKLVRRVEAERKLASQSRLMAHKKRGAESVTRGDRDRKGGGEGDATTVAAKPTAPRKLGEGVEERRAAAIEERIKWEKNHSGSFELAYPSPCERKQALYEKLLVGAKESFENHGQVARVRDVMEKAKYTALRRATEEEVRQNAIKNGIKIPAGMELKKVVEAVMKARADGGSETLLTAPKTWSLGDCPVPMLQMYAGVPDAKKSEKERASRARKEARKKHAAAVAASKKKAAEEAAAAAAAMMGDDGRCSGSGGSSPNSREGEVTAALEYDSPFKRATIQAILRRRMEEAEAAAAAGGGAAMRSVPLPERFDSTNGGWGLGGTGIRPAAKAPSKSRRAMSMTSSSLNNPYAPSDGGAVRGGGEFSNQSNYFAGTLRSGDVRSSSGAMIPGRRGTTSSQKSLASSTVGAKAPAAASNSNSKGIFRAVEEVKVTKGVGSADPAFLKRVNSMSLTSSPRSGASVRAINPATRERK